MKVIEIDQTAEIDEALNVVYTYVHSLRNHPVGLVASGASVIASSDTKLAVFAVKLAAELLVRDGTVDAKLS